MIYLDANVLYACVANVAGQTDLAERLLRRKEVFCLSALTDYETRKALLTHGGGEEHLERLDDLRAAKLVWDDGWDAALAQALKLARQFKMRLAVDSADTLHVGWALALGAHTFASFDRERGPRALALCVGLKVWPGPGPKDYEQMKRLKS